MSRLKRILVILVITLAVVLLGVTAAAFITRHSYLTDNVFMGETPYPKDAETVDLRGTGISIDYYLELQSKLPDCNIRWEVPFQGDYYDPDTREITITSLTQADIETLDYITGLTAVHAENCTDYTLLMELQQRRPECTVSYVVPIGGTDYPQDTTQITLTGMTEEDAAQISYLPQLTQLHLIEPKASAETVLALESETLSVTCEMEILGITVTNEMTELDYTGIALADTSQLEDLAYFPDLEKVIVSDCGLDNETLAAYREAKRQEYKLVWTVQCGKLTVRTDDIYFMPVKYNIYYFHDEDAYNLRYCEDMVCIDLGHMSIHDLDFVRYMPNLTYLILAHTTVLDITPLSECKNLKFLELDWTGVKDYTPLLGCTALEDLNLGNTYGDIAPITQMTWLKNLWWTGRNYGFKQSMENELPNTHKEFNATHTVSNGWRKLQNYYDMRDILGMEYM